MNETKLDVETMQFQASSELFDELANQCARLKYSVNKKVDHRTELLTT